MKDLISQSVNDALSKRKEEREKKKQNSSHKSNSELQDVIQEQKVKFFE
jgi:DNA-binding protein YbaB